MFSIDMLQSRNVWMAKSRHIAISYFSMIYPMSAWCIVVVTYDISKHAYTVSNRQVAWYVLCNWQFEIINDNILAVYSQ